MSDHHNREPIEHDDGAPVLIDWFDNPKNVDRVVYLTYAICALFVVGDLLWFGLHFGEMNLWGGISHHAKHGHYPFEELLGFHAIYGFISCVVLVLAATQLRKVIMREEDYYE